MRVVQTPPKSIQTENVTINESACQETPGSSTASAEEDVQPLPPAEPSTSGTFQIGTDSNPTQVVWPNLSSEALLASLDEPSESSSAQSSPSPTTSVPSSTSGSLRSTSDGTRSSAAASAVEGAADDPLAVQRRYRYIRSRIPVRGHSFCSCLDSPNRTEGRFLECMCGEEYGSVCEWTWDNLNKSTAAKVQDDSRTVIFHPNFSNGTAAVRGTHPMREGQHFWEVKMITPVYGTNMMVGVGTKDINMDSCSTVFCSMLGHNADSWGLSYQAHFHHGGQIWQYGSMFGQGSLVGLHLDCWNGTLSFYKNRRPLGVACRNLIAKEVYPMLCSTAARSGMRLVRTQSCDSTLQYLCCRALRKIIPSHLDVMTELLLPPGLKDYLSSTYGWLLSSVVEPIKPPQDEKEQNNPPSSDADIEAGNTSSMEGASAYPVLADRDIIFERFVERLHTGRFVAQVHDSVTPAASQHSDSNEQTTTGRGHFSQHSSAATSREQPGGSSWMPKATSAGVGSGSGEGHSTTVASQSTDMSTPKGPYLSRNLKRKRTIANESDISLSAKASLVSQEKLGDEDDCSEEKHKKLRRIKEYGQPSANQSPKSSELPELRFESDTPVLDRKSDQRESEHSPSTPYSSFSSTGSSNSSGSGNLLTTPPNDRSTPVSNLLIDDFNIAQNSSPVKDDEVLTIEHTEEETDNKGGNQ